MSWRIGLVLLCCTLIAVPVTAQTDDTPPRPFLAELWAVDFEGGEMTAPPWIWQIVTERDQHVLCYNVNTDKHPWPIRLGWRDWQNYAVELRIRAEPESEVTIQTRDIASGDSWFYLDSGVPYTADRRAYQHVITFGTEQATLTQHFCTWEYASYLYLATTPHPDCVDETSATRPLDTAGWHLLRAEVDGDQIRTFLDNELVLEQTSTRDQTGDVMIVPVTRNQFCIDDITLRLLDRTPDAVAAAPRGTVQGDGTLYTWPGYRELTTLDAGTEVFVLDWSPDREWVYVRHDPSSVQGWLPVDALQTTVAVPPPDPDAPAPYTPPTFGDVTLAFDFEDDDPGWMDWQQVTEDGDGLYCQTSGQDEWQFTPISSQIMAHYTVEAQVRVTSLGRNAGFSILTRHQNTGDWQNYVHAFNVPPGDFVGVGQLGCIDECDWQGVNRSLQSGAWYQFRAEVDGDHVRTFLDGQLMIDQTRDELVSGLAAFNVMPFTELCVDDVVIRTLVRTPTMLDGVTLGTTTAGLNLRLGPGTDQPVITTLSAGVQVMILEWGLDRTWAYVRHDESGLMGWVSAEYLTIP